MARYSLVILAAVVSSLTACGTESPSTSMPIAEGGVPFRCPAAGTKVVFNNSRFPMEYNGADPTDPFVCLATAPNGTRIRRYGGIYGPIPGQDREIREGLVRLFPLSPGKTVRFSYFKGYNNDPTRRDVYNETWTVGTPTRLQVGNRSVEAVPVTQEVENNQSFASNGWRWRRFYGVESGVWLRAEPELLRGQVSGLIPSTATSLSTP